MGICIRDTVDVGFHSPGNLNQRYRPAAVIILMRLHSSAKSRDPG